VVRSGKVRYLGFFNWSAWKVSAALEIQQANGLAPFTYISLRLTSASSTLRVALSGSPYGVAYDPVRDRLW
jgi:aryl-alcohol dehydrogenase-like predicted oxidoreductase